MQVKGGLVGRTSTWEVGEGVNSTPKEAVHLLVFHLSQIKVKFQVLDFGRIFPK